LLQCKQFLCDDVPGSLEHDSFVRGGSLRQPPKHESIFGSKGRQLPNHGTVMNMTTTPTQHNMQGTKTAKPNQPICIHTFNEITKHGTNQPTYDPKQKPTKIKSNKPIN
jgi:hypothetical protein